MTTRCADKLSPLNGLANRGLIRKATKGGKFYTRSPVTEGAAARLMSCRRWVGSLILMVWRKRLQPDRDVRGWKMGGKAATNGLDGRSPKPLGIAPPKSSRSGTASPLFLMCSLISFCENGQRRSNRTVAATLGPSSQICLVRQDR